MTVIDHLDPYSVHSPSWTVHIPRLVCPLNKMTSEWTVKTWHTAGTFLDACGQELMKRRSISANFALTTSFELVSQQDSGQKDEVRVDSRDIWLSASTTNADRPHDTVPVYAIAIVGKHAGRLASSIDPVELPPSQVADAMRLLVDAVNDAGVPGSRIFGVIGPKALCVPFADAWAATYGLQPKPVIDFAIAHVTRATLRPSSRALPENVTLGLCTLADLDVAAEMCERATHPMDEPVPPPLDAAAARAHAKKLIEGKHLYGAWVDGVLRTLVSITRETPLVRAVSKVYTAPEARGRGLAEDLVRFAIEK